MRKELVRSSKFLSLLLRHAPGRIGIELDAQGWADLDELIARSAEAGRHLSLATIDEVVATNEKKRFEFSPDRKRIRARQGHSLDIDLGLSPLEPPTLLFHGTAARNLSSIRRQGLLPAKRQHVHLSLDVATATTVGARHGKPVVLEVEALKLHQSGQAFYRSANGVWLTERVAAAAIRFPEASDA